MRQKAPAATDDRIHVSRTSVFHSVTVLMGAGATIRHRIRADLDGGRSRPESCNNCREPRSSRPACTMACTPASDGDSATLPRLALHILTARPSANRNPHLRPVRRPTPTPTHQPLSVSLQLPPPQTPEVAAPRELKNLGLFMRRQNLARAELYIGPVKPSNSPRRHRHPRSASPSPSLS